MDQLSRDAKEARKRGLSYGKYKGLQYEQELKSKEAAAPKKPRKPKPGERRCKTCGKEIPLTVSSSRYCSPECAEKAQLEMRRVREQRHKLAMQGVVLPHEPETKCGICGKTVKDKRRKYCCPECAEEARRLQTAASKMRAKWRAGKI